MRSNKGSSGPYKAADARRLRCRLNVILQHKVKPNGCLPGVLLRRKHPVRLGSVERLEPPVHQDICQLPRDRHPLPACLRLELGLVLLHNSTAQWSHNPWKSMSCHCSPRISDLRRPVTAATRTAVRCMGDFSPPRMLCISANERMSGVFKRLLLCLTAEIGVGRP